MANCPTCMFMNNAGAAVCQECGYRFLDASAGAIQAPASKPVNPVVRQAILGAVALSVPILVMVVINHNGRVAKQQARSAHWEAVAQQEIEANRVDEIGIVTECDIAVKRSLTAQNSYDAGDWKFTVEGSEARVLRKFDATNGFGGTITSGYTCIYNNASKRIASLEVISPNGYRKLR